MARIWNQARMRQQTYTPPRKHKPLVVEPDAQTVTLIRNRDYDACKGCGYHVCSCMPHGARATIVGTDEADAQPQPGPADELPEGWERIDPALPGQERVLHGSGAVVWAYACGRSWAFGVRSNGLPASVSGFREDRDEAMRAALALALAHAERSSG